MEKNPATYQNTQQEKRGKNETFEVISTEEFRHLIRVILLKIMKKIFI